jgi:beta-lactamase regulating signal transducer with metallopeptidase domain
METYLHVILSLTVSGSLFTITLWMLQPVLRKSLSGNALKGLWLVVMLRYLIPVEWLDYAELASRSTMFADLAPNTAVFALPQVLQENVGPFWIIAVIVWAAGALLRGILLWWKDVRLIRGIHRTSESPSEDDYGILTICCERMRIRRRIGLLRSSAVPTPIVIGIVRPVIVLPKHCYSMQELQMILTHELVHAARFDLLLKVFLRGVLAVHWFNPFVLLLGRHCIQSMEMACDAEVCRRLEADDRKRYCTLLLQQPSTTMYRGSSVQALSGAGKSMKGRIQAILHAGTGSRFAMLMYVVVVLVFVALPLPSSTAIATGLDDFGGRIVGVMTWSSGAPVCTYCGEGFLVLRGYTFRTGAQQFCQDHRFGVDVEVKKSSTSVRYCSWCRIGPEDTVGTLDWVCAGFDR